MIDKQGYVTPRRGECDLCHRFAEALYTDPAEAPGDYEYCGRCWDDLARIVGLVPGPGPIDRAVFEYLYNDCEGA